MEQSQLDSDFCPLRFEIALVSLLFSVLAVVYVTMLAVRKTPLAMKAYRSLIIDSIQLGFGLVQISCWLFTAYSILVMSPSFAFADEVLVVYPMSLMYAVLPLRALNFFAVRCVRGEAFQGAQAVYAIILFNTLRSTINCFKHRFENVCSGDRRLHFKLKRHLLIAVFGVSVLVVVYAAYTGIHVNATPTLLRVHSLGLENVRVFAATFHVSLTWLLPLCVIMALYVALFVFYTYATNHTVKKKMKKVSVLSRSTIKAQMRAFTILQIQFLATMLVMLPSLAIIVLVITLPSKATVFCGNIACFFVLSNYGTVYPVVVLLTTKPYMTYTIHLLRCYVLGDAASSVVIYRQDNTDSTKDGVVSIKTLPK